MPLKAGASPNIFRRLFKQNISKSLSDLNLYIGTAGTTLQLPMKNIKNKAGLFVFAILFAHPLLAVDGKKAAYIGGTVTAIPEKAEGVFATILEDKIVFTHKKGVWELPYSGITGLEYGQKAGRRVGVAIMVSPLALFSKKRNHFLTINYDDKEGKPQAAVFEIGKDIIRITLTIVQTRSGKQIEYQDDEARKAGSGGSD